MTDGSSPSSQTRERPSASGGRRARSRRGFIGNSQKGTTIAAASRVATAKRSCRVITYGTGSSEGRRTSTTSCSCAITTTNSCMKAGGGWSSNSRTTAPGGGTRGEVRSAKSYLAPQRQELISVVQGGAPDLPVVAAARPRRAQITDAPHRHHRERYRRGVTFGSL